MKKMYVKHACALFAVVLIVLSGCAKEETVETQQAETKIEQNFVDENIEYTDCSVIQLAEEIAKNSFRAKNTYINKYLRLSGTLERIDSDGEYVVLTSQKIGMYATVQCYLTQEAQKDTLLNFNVGDSITLLGKVTDVGDVAEYTLEIHKFE